MSLSSAGVDSVVLPKHTTTPFFKSRIFGLDDWKPYMELGINSIPKNRLIKTPNSRMLFPRKLGCRNPDCSN